MNKNQVAGAVKTAAGKVQQKVGKAIGSEKQQAKGLSAEAQGRMDKAYGDVKEALKNSRHE